MILADFGKDFQKISCLKDNPIKRKGSSKGEPFCK